MTEQKNQATGGQNSDRQSKRVAVSQQGNIGEQQPGHEAHRRDRERPGEQTHQQVQRQISLAALLKPLQQRQTRGGREAAAHAQKGVFHQVGEQDQAHQGKPEAGTGCGGRHQVGATDAGTSQQDARPEAASHP